MKDIDLGDAMKEGMRRLASGVCVLSTQDNLGRRFAMTASSVTSVSDTPASLLVCVNQETSMYQALEEGVGFCVNILSQHQQDVSNRCATGDQGESRFDNGEWVQSQPDQLPYLTDAQAAFFCDQASSFLFGTHKIYIGTIRHVMVSEGPVEPLIYVDGNYRIL